MVVVVVVFGGGFSFLGVAVVLVFVLFCVSLSLSVRVLIVVLDGLSFLAGCLSNKEFGVHVLKKVIYLVHDLLLNDDGILKEDPEHVRKMFTTTLNITPRLLEIIETQSHNLLEDGNAAAWDTREYALRSLFRMAQVKTDLAIEH